MARLSPHNDRLRRTGASELAVSAPLEEPFRSLIEQLPAITYTESPGDTDTYTFISPQVEALLGYTPAEIIDSPGFAASRIHPHDRARVDAEGARTTATGEPFRIEYRMQARDGRWLHIRDEAVLVRDETGRPLHWQGVLADVSEQRRVEEALRASEERFRALVQGSYDVITLVDRHGNRTYASPSIERVLGYAPAELVGRAAADLVHPDDAPVLKAAIEHCLAGAAQTPPLELRFRHRNGEWHDFETVGTNLLDTPGVNGIVFNSREITARKVAEAALRKSESRFRTAFDHAPIGLAIVAADGRFRQVNRSLCELTGYDEATLLGMTYQEITHPDDLSDALEVAKRLSAGEIDTYQMEKRYIRKDGHPIWIELTASGVQDDDGSRYTICQIQDVTGRRHLDLERATMLASERAYTKQLRELAALREDLSKVVAHELRSPVAAMRMMTAALGTGDLAPDEAAGMIAAIHGQIDQLDRLITDVTAAAAAEREQVPVQFHSVPLTVLISGAATYARSVLGDRPFTVGSSPETLVWCDPERISQVLQNLLDNIAKHTPPGSPVELRTRRHDNQVQIAVADRGPGIPAEDLPKIFEKYGRGREASDRQRPGLGLGLYVSYQIIQAHGAELTVQSESDGGTVFAFDLRVAR